MMAVLAGPEQRREPARIGPRLLIQRMELVAPHRRTDEHRPALAVGQRRPDHLRPHARLHLGELVEHHPVEIKAAQPVRIVCAIDEERAVALRETIESHFSTADGSLRSEDGADAIRESNPHMHLLEACLAWAEIGGDPGWTSWVRRLAELAVSRFIRKDSGAIGESYTAAWQPAPGLAGRIIEPGHQFEWAWLLAAM